ncbi:MAG: hypothetical protein R6V67_02615 [Spirochaetia bacterium]
MAETSFQKDVGWYRGSGPKESVIVASRIRLSRNISGKRFPHKMEIQEEQEVQELIEQAFSTMKKGRNKDHLPRVVKLKDISPRGRKMLIEKHFISQQFSLEKEKSLIFDEKEMMGGMVNEKDHLRLASFTPGLNLGDAYKNILPVEKELEKSLDFAVSLDRGYLTPHIKQCGTGLRGSVLLHLPALENSSLLERAFKSVMQEGLSVKGFMGDDNHSLGYFYQLYNPVGIGESEKEIIEKLARVASQLVDYEEKVREEMVRHKRVELEDIVWRAYGILLNCRIIEEREAIGLLSDLRLGVALGWIDLPFARLNSLFVESRKAHVQDRVDGDENEITVHTVKHERARMIRELLGLGRQ